MINNAFSKRCTILVQLEVYWCTGCVLRFIIKCRWNATNEIIVFYVVAIRMYLTTKTRVFIRGVLLTNSKVTF